jgi:hypothetical protein
MAVGQRFRDFPTIDVAIRNPKSIVRSNAVAHRIKMLVKANS